MREFCLFKWYFLPSGYRLHRIAAGESNVSVHICNLAAQSGVTRFTEMYPDWSYSKDENITMDDPKMLIYSYILVEQKGKYFYENEHLQQSHDTLESINCFNNIGVEYRSLLPVKIRTKPCIVLLRRKKELKIPPALISEEQFFQNKEELSENIVEKEKPDPFNGDQKPIEDEIED